MSMNVKFRLNFFKFQPRNRWVANFFFLCEAAKFTSRFYSGTPSWRRDINNPGAYARFQIRESTDAQHIYHKKVVQGDGTFHFCSSLLPSLMVWSWCKLPFFFKTCTHKPKIQFRWRQKDWRWLTPSRWLETALPMRIHRVKRAFGMHELLACSEAFSHFLFFMVIHVTWVDI